MCFNLNCNFNLHIAATVVDKPKLVITTGSKLEHNSTAMHGLLWLDSNDSLGFWVGNLSDNN